MSSSPEKRVPPDPEGLNDARAEWAEVAIAAFAEQVFHNPADRTDYETVVMDLLCDMHHFCDRHNVDWVAVAERAHQIYLQETEKEVAEPSNGTRVDGVYVGGGSVPGIGLVGGGGPGVQLTGGGGPGVTLMGGPGRAIYSEVNKAAREEAAEAKEEDSDQ